MNLNNSLIFLILSLALFHLETTFGNSSNNKHSNSNNDENNDNDDDVTSNDSDNDSTSTLPNSCADLSDGYHWLKLLEGDDYPVVYQLCDNGYMVLDYNMDNNIVKYFDSWQQWHLHTVGPTNAYSINWQQWYLPDSSQEGPLHSVGEVSVDYSFRDDTSEDDYYSGDSGMESDVMNYIISPDCQSCEVDSTRQLYDTSTTYWMTGTIFGCSWVVKATYKCNVDLLDDTCYVCHEDHSDLSDTERFAINDASVAHDFDATGVCPHNVQKAYNHIVPFHDECTLDQSGDLKHLKPSLGIKGKYCVCVQPKSDTEYFEITEKDTQNMIMYNRNEKNNIDNNSENKIKKDAQEDDEEEEEEEDEIDEENEQASYDGNPKHKEPTDDTKVDKKLYQADFEHGTYRIRIPGTYTIMEDIDFDFKANKNKPNVDGAYWPTSDDIAEYPGAGDVRGPYFMGFFAGITIECNDVTLDLNGHTLKMSEYFYYQQRWFTTIELGTQYFLPGQGIGNFGASPSMANNVVIKDGVLGLTSHHGIHGNYNQNIKLENLIVKGFETHGIQFNGFYDIELVDVEVGPTSDHVRFNGEYAHMRAMLPRYKVLCEELDEEEDRVLFYGRTESLSMCDIAEEVELEMDMAFDYVTKGKTYTIEKDGESMYESFASSLKLFVNDNDISVPYGSAQFGIFLNTYDASVLTYSLYTPFVSSKAVLTNIKIHDMSHAMREYIRIQRPSSGDFVMNPFAGPLDAEEMFEGFDRDDKRAIDRSNLQYKGNIILDSYIAMNYLSDNWGYLQMQIVGNNFIVPWALGTNPARLTPKTMSLGCNMDVMIHSGKGINGLRLDGVENVEISNIEIYNLFEYTPLGATVCGEYSGTNCNECGNDGGHFRQTEPMQVGFSGNMNQGININSATNIIIKDANIHDLHSETGPVYGISIWPSCDVTLKGDIIVENMVSGKDVELNTYTYDDMPNQAPEMCGIRVVWGYQNNENYETSVGYDEANIVSQCLDGHVGCLGDKLETAPTMIGEFNDDTSGCSVQGINILQGDNVLQEYNKNENESIDISSRHKNWYGQGVAQSAAIVAIVMAIFGLYLMRKITFGNGDKNVKGGNGDKFMYSRISSANSNNVYGNDSIITYGGV